MLNKRSWLLALGLSGAAVIAVLNIAANRLQRADARAQRKALQRWEGEGGNLVKPAMPAAGNGELPPDGVSKA